MNTVFDPLIFIIAETDWQDSDKRDEFLQHLLDNLKNITEYNEPECSITRFYWSDELEALLYNAPQLHPWQTDKDFREPVVRIIHKYFRSKKCQESIEIPQDTLPCKIEKKCDCENKDRKGYEFKCPKKEIHDYFLKLMHILIDRNEIVYLCLGINNEPPQKEGYTFSCSCHSYRLKPVLIQNANDWFSHIPDDLDTTSWNHKDNYLPRRTFSNRLVDDDWDKFRKKLKAMRQRPDRIARIEKMGEMVARINGYKFERELSRNEQRRKKSKRIIYRAGTGHHTIYLSIDFEKGAFEVCDFHGKHLGEFGFDGKQTGSPDKNGGHDISISIP